MTEAARHTPTIKTLEWRYFPAAFPNAWDAETPFGRYSVEERWGPNVEPPDWHQDANSTWALTFSTHQVVGVYAALEKAKEAAQADYERRILSVFDPSDFEAQERLIETLTGALTEAVAVSKSGADTISFLTDLHRVAKLCATALAQARNAKRIEQP